VSRSREFYTSVNGVSGRVPPFRDQTQRLYDAEWLWKHNAPAARQTISEQGTRDLVGEILHHKALDNFPDIHRLRDPETWNANDRIDFDGGNHGLAWTDSAGYMNFDADKPLHVGMVTHETAHLANLLGHQFSDGGGGEGFEHEWPFAATHLHIVHNTMGKDSSIPLKNAYRMFGAQWMPKHRG
jgi:hypothetical protein